MRTFSDRLIDDEDKELFVTECLNFDESKFFKKDEIANATNLIFCNFVKPELEDPIYMESKDNDLLRLAL